MIWKQEKIVSLIGELYWSSNIIENKYMKEKEDVLMDSKNQECGKDNDG